MKKIKILLIDHMGLFVSEKKRYDALANYNDLELTVLVPSSWKFNYKLYSFEERMNGNYQIMNSEVAFPGFAHRSFYLTSMKKILKACRPDIIHVFQEPFSFFAAQAVLARNLYSPFSKILFISWENINHKKFPFFFSKIHKMIESYTFKNSICATPITSTAKQVLKDRGYRGKCEVMNWGIDLELFQKQNSLKLKRKLRLIDKYVIGFIGRFVKEKGVLDLIQAVSRLEGDNRLLLIGDGPLKTEINKLIEKLDMRDIATIIESVPNSKINLYLNCLNLLVLPSRTSVHWKEQFGRVLIEAMASEIPVIGSDVGEIPNVIGNSELIFRAGDHAELMNKIKAIKSDKIDSNDIIKWGKKRVTNIYSWEMISERLHNLYFELMLKEHRN